MSKLQWLGTLGMLAVALSTAWAQDDSQSTPSTAPPQPAAAYGQENSPPAVSENPPISGIDLPNLEPHAAPLSYLQPGGTVSESADSNIGSSTGTQSFRSITRGIGSLALQRVWSHYDLAMQYEGGVAYYDQSGIGWKALQQMDLQQKISWKRGELSVRDSFSYLPEGNFGAAYGSLGSQGIASMGETSFGSFWGGTSLGTLGIVPRIMNVALADLSENLSPKSAITAAGGYALTHFYGTDPQTGSQYLNNTQISGQFGYDRTLSAHTQVALVYGYQAFDFTSVGTSFHSNIIQAMYGHRISGRLDFLIAAGPQFTNIAVASEVCSNSLLPPGFLCSLGGGTNLPSTDRSQRIGVAGQMRFRYRFPRTSLELSYQRFETSGSGLFAGAQTDIARLRVDRPINRVWSGFGDLGYSRNARVAQLSTAQLSTCVFPGQSNPNSLPPCPGIDANTYTYGFIGVGVHRAFGRDFHGFASYQFNELAFDHSYCGGLPACSRIGNRNVITIGLDWTPRPIRLD